MAEPRKGGLIDVNGVLYGTTAYGGNFRSKAGTVFSITTSGTEHVLHSFGRIRKGKRDGKVPVASLIDVGGVFYGTTVNGGAYDDGTVFSITASGRERVLHNFDYSGSDSDGARPFASLISVNSTLYGTTVDGGTPYFTDGGGTVFSISTNGNETVLHRFMGGKTDGANPTASLIDVKGTLYGTTSDGGTYGKGTVFSITTSGTDQVLHSFGDAGDGANPASLIEVKGTLYGTTSEGGRYGGCATFVSQQLFCGTVFSVTPSGAEKVLHDFGGASDGKNPTRGLINVKGTLYGTTDNGGTYGFGTVFSISTSGTEQVLHSFGSGPDGAYPRARLIDVNGTLYGTTTGGGTHGNGTVYALTP